MYILLSTIILVISFCLLFLSNSTRNIIIYVFSICLLLYKSIEYTIYGLHLEVSKIPIEYSTITYFLLSVAVIFQLNKLKPIAAFMGFISGLGYMITFSFLGESYIANNGLYLTIMAFINHSLVLIIGLLLMREQKFRVLDKKSILLFTTIYVIYVLVVSYFVTFKQTYIFILMLLGGDILNMIVPNGQASSFDYLLYFLIILLVYRVVINIFIRFNHRLCNMKERISNEHTV